VTPARATSDDVRYFTYYWNRSQFRLQRDAWEEHGTVRLVDYTGGTGFRGRVRPGDELYILNWAHDCLWVIGRMTVGQVLDTAQATTLLGTVYEADEHVVAEPGTATPMVFDAYLGDEDRGVDVVEFVAGDGTVVLPKRDATGAVEPQTFRNVREITEGTASQLDWVLGIDAGSEVEPGGPYRRWTTFDLLVRDDEGEERDLFIELTVEGPTIADRYVEVDLSVPMPVEHLDASTLSPLLWPRIEQQAAALGVAVVEDGVRFEELLQESLTSPDGMAFTWDESSARFPGVPMPTGCVSIGGSEPHEFFVAGSRTAPRGARTEEELPPIPDPSCLPPAAARAQEALRRIVERAGGRLDPATDSIWTGVADEAAEFAVVGDMLEEWVRHYGERLDGGVHFRSRGQGGWYAFDRLVPLQNPNRWDGFRKRAYTYLEEHRGWYRLGAGDRASDFWVPDDPATPPPAQLTGTSGRILQITLADWKDEPNEELGRSGRGYRADLSMQELVTINRGRWRTKPDKAAEVAEVVYVHDQRVVGVAAVRGDVQVLSDGRIAWAELEALPDDPRIGQAAQRSYGNPLRYL
jgi:hypothetical protein